MSSRDAEAADFFEERLDLGAVGGRRGPREPQLVESVSRVLGVLDAEGFGGASGLVGASGEGLTGLSVPRICQRGIARTFQLTALFPEMTARENVRLAAQARGPRHWRFLGGGAIFAKAGKRADSALELLGLTGVADRLAGVLSHGDQRLLEIAMALVQNPRLLLLDEPTQGLSVEETAHAVETLAALLGHGNMTVLLVEHDMEVVFQLADKITVLHRGAVIADGSPQTIRDDTEVQRAYLGGLS